MKSFGTKTIGETFIQRAVIHQFLFFSFTKIINSLFTVFCLFHFRESLNLMSIIGVQ